jgi:hypothetical protein
MNHFHLAFINGAAWLMLGLVLVFWGRLRTRFTQQRNIFDLVAFVMAFKLAFYAVLPALLRIVSDWAQDRQYQVEPAEVAYVYAIEFVSVCAWMAAVYLVVAVLRGDRAGVPQASVSPRPARDRQAAPDPAILFMAGICVLYVLTFPVALVGELRADSAPSLWQPVVGMAGPIMGVYLMVRGRRAVGWLAFAAGSVAALLALALSFFFGSRGLMISLALWMMFLVLFVQRTPRYILAGLALVVVVLVFRNVMTAARMAPDARGQSLVGMVDVMRELRAAGEQQSSLLQDLEFRFGVASRHSAAFVRMQEEGAGAGISPIVSALYTPVPRRFLPEKPEIGSMDGTRQGMGMYLINAVIDPGSGNMSEFYTGAHAYWEFGALGVVVLSMFSGAVVALLVCRMGFLGAAALPMIMIMMKPPWLEPKLWVAQLIAHLLHVLVPLLLLWVVSVVIVTVLAKAGRPAVPSRAHSVR